MVSGFALCDALSNYSLIWVNLLMGRRQLTKMNQQEPLAQQLPHRTLHMELQELIADGGPWLNEPVFAQAVGHLLPIVASLHIPLAFSSGDYNPGNFLFEGEVLTGFIDIPNRPLLRKLLCFAKPLQEHDIHVLASLNYMLYDTDMPRCLSTHG